jgi:hypothetical protein
MHVHTRARARAHTRDSDTDSDSGAPGSAGVTARACRRWPASAGAPGWPPAARPPFCSHSPTAACLCGGVRRRACARARACVRARVEGHRIVRHRVWRATGGRHTRGPGSKAGRRQRNSAALLHVTPQHARRRCDITPVMVIISHAASILSSGGMFLGGGACARRGCGVLAFARVCQVCAGTCAHDTVRRTAVRPTNTPPPSRARAAVPTTQPHPWTTTCSRLSSSSGSRTNTHTHTHTRTHTRVMGHDGVAASWRRLTPPPLPSSRHPTTHSLSTHTYTPRAARGCTPG